ncbi:hypothetical protein Asp14428_27100 [Actinoplanes sp. NBRC 14428]|nr:hypothetical protein Asp14428_27100 [Actinoplanes sp. NBRC 14428]
MGTVEKAIEIAKTAAMDQKLTPELTSVCVGAAVTVMSSPCSGTIIESNED